MCAGKNSNVEDSSDRKNKEENDSEQDSTEDSRDDITGSLIPRENLQRIKESGGFCDL